MYCSKCGKKIGNKNDQYCKKCGKTLTENKTSTNQDAPQNPPPVQKQKTSCCLKIFLGILGLIFIVALIGFFVAMNPDNLEKLKTHSSAIPSSNKTKTSTPQSDTSQNESLNDDETTIIEPSETQTPAQAEPDKRMYYWVGCGDCQNPGCQDSYHYAGWDERDWLINKTLCESCTCNDLKARSYYP